MISSSDSYFSPTPVLRVSHWQLYAKILGLYTGYCKLLCLTSNANWGSSRDSLLANYFLLFADFDEVHQVGTLSIYVLLVWTLLHFLLM